MPTPAPPLPPPPPPDDGDRIARLRATSRVLARRAAAIARRVATWARETAVPAVVRASRAAAVRIRPAALRFAAWMRTTAIPRGVQIAKQAREKSVAASATLAARLREWHTQRQQARATRPPDPPKDDPVPPLPPTVEEAVVGTPEKPSASDAAPVAARPRRKPAHALSRLAGPLRGQGFRRWVFPAAALAVIALLGLILLGKMRREVWAYYTDDAGTRVEVREDKTRHVLWEDPQPHHFAPPEDPQEARRDPLNAPAGRIEAAFSPSGTAMVLVRWQSPATNADLYLSEWSGCVWSRPVPLEDLNTASNERGPAFSHDGRFLFFSSDRPGGAGGYDLYAARRVGQAWTGAAPLGPAVNSAADESGPALSANGRQLYFSSNRNSAREDDIFVATLLQPEEPDSLPAVLSFAPAEAVSHLNSRAHDVQAALTSRGEHVFLASDRDRNARKGYGVYFSRVVDGVSLAPEPVDLYLESGDATDPAVRMDGFDLLFSASPETSADGEEGQFRLYRSTTREVIGYTDLSRWAQFKEILSNVAWWILLAVAALLALIYLLETWQDITSLFHKCLAGSAVVHLLLLLAAMLWLIAQEFESEAQPPPDEISVSVDALAEEELAMESAPDESDIEQPDLDLQAQKAESNFDVPEMEPQEDQNAFPIDAEVAREAMQVEVKPAAADSADQPATEPSEPSALFSELSETVLPEPEPPVLEERVVENVEAAQPADAEFRPAESTPMTERSEAPPLAGNAADQPTSASEISPSESVADDPAPAPLTEVRPEQSDPSPVSPTDSAPPLDSQLLTDLPQAAPPDANAPALDEGSGAPAAAPADAARDLFDPGNALPSGAIAKSDSGATRDAAAESNAQPAEVAGGSTEPAPAATDPTSLVGEAHTESALPEAALPASAPTLDLPATALLDPGAPRLDEGDRSAEPADQSHDVFSPNPGAPQSAAQLEAAAAADSAAPAPAEASEVATGTLAASPSPASPAASPAESLPADSLPESALAAAALPEASLLDPAAPHLDEGSQPAPPADSSQDMFRPAPGAPQTAATPLDATPAAGAAASSQADSAEVERGPLAAEPASPGPSLLPAEANATSELLATTLAPDDLGGSPMSPSLDAPRLEEGAPTPAPADPSEHLFRPGGAVASTEQAQASALRDQASPSPPRSDAVAAGTVAGESAHPTDPHAGLEAAQSRELLGGALNPATLGPLASVSLLPRELEAPAQDARAMTDFLKKQDGRPSIDIIKQLGGSDGTERAIRESIRWLAENQEPDGRWNARKHGAKGNFDTGVTGLALLCFYDWGARHDHDGEYRAHVRRGLDYLLKIQKDDGDLGGDGLMYCHAIASIALCEAYSITRDPRIREPAERSIRYTLDAQSKSKGGWRYHPGEDSDTSITGWQYMALHSARLAGLDVPEESFALVRKWLARVGGGQHGGIYGYQAPARNSPAMVATGMFCRQLDLVPPGDPQMLESASFLKMHPMQARNLDYYYIYYATLALYQHQGPVWETWNERLKDTLPLAQEKTGARKGSWPASRGLAGNGGRVTSTALATLSLEVYYRLLPMYGFRGDEPPPVKVKQPGE